MVEWGGRWCTLNRTQCAAVNRSSMRLSANAGGAESRQSLCNYSTLLPPQHLSNRAKSSLIGNRSKYYSWRLRQPEASKWMRVVLLKRVVVSQDEEPCES